MTLSNLITYLRYVIKYVMNPSPDSKDYEKDPDVLKKTMRKTLITYLNPMYLQCFSQAPFYTESKICLSVCL